MEVSRLFFAGALTVFIAGSLASVGELGDATRSTKHSLVAVVRTALTRSRPAYDLDSPAADQYAPAKAIICHNGHTIMINRSALPAHLRNGDTSGPCSEVAGVNAARRRDAALPASTRTGDSLASTGLSLGVHRTELAPADDNRPGAEATNKATASRSLASLDAHSRDVLHAGAPGFRVTAPRLEASRRHRAPAPAA
jgi:hypothetical protein